MRKVLLFVAIFMLNSAFIFAKKSDEPTKNECIENCNVMSEMNISQCGAYTDLMVTDRQENFNSFCMNLVNSNTDSCIEKCKE